MSFLDPFNFNPLSFAPQGDNNALAAGLLKLGQGTGGLLDQPVPELAMPFRMPSKGTPSLSGAPLPEVITGGPAPAGPAMGYASEAPRAGSVPMPRPKDAQEDDEAIPETATPTAGLAAAAATPPAASDDTPAAPQGMLDRIGSGLRDNSNLLIALGAGFAGAPSWGAGINRALTGAQATLASDDARNEKLKAAGAAYRALIAKGVSPDDALAATQNPEILRTLTAAKFGNGDRDFAFRQAEAARAQANADRTYRLAERQADRADEGAVELSADRAKAAQQFGLVPGTAEYKSYVLTGELPKATVDNSLIQQAEQRKAMAANIGLAPDNPAYNAFILTGKMPREDQAPLTAKDKETIIEADDQVMAAKSAIDALKKAKTLSPGALGFKGAGTIASVGSAVVPSSLGGNTLEKTAELDNIVTSNALTQLKAIFGGNPTEGERAIMLQIQGSSSLPDAVRQKVYDRAIEMAQRRLDFNQQRADELRNGGYYKPKKATENAAAPAGGSYVWTPGGGLVSAK